MQELKKNDIFAAVIDGYSSDGAGVCRIEGRAVFVPRALMGETWEIRLVKVTASAVFGRGERLVSPSPERIEPACPVFGRCGGCDWLHAAYAEELRYKLRRVNDALTRIAGIDFTISEIVGSERTEGYRNKAVYTFGVRDGEPVCGFFRPRTHDVIPVSRCLIQPELADRAADAVLRWAKDRHVPVYDETAGRGSLRHLYVRRAVKTPEAVACVVTARGFGRDTAPLVNALRVACPELTGIVLCVNKTRGNTVLTGQLHTLWGRETIHDELCSVKFEISPFAFFQINPPQAERLYARALEYAALGENETALDLYCGAGTISLCLAKRAGHVIGAEIVPEAVENAAANAEANGITNAEFICADAGQAARALRERGVTPAAVVVDPPRKGLSPDVVETVASMAPGRIVYVSCDPATMARDVKLFAGHGWRLTAGTAFDLFPRCSHVETVCLLSKVS